MDTEKKWNIWKKKKTAHYDVTNKYDQTLFFVVFFDKKITFLARH